MLYKRFTIDEMVNLINVYFIYYKKNLPEAKTFIK